MDKAAGPQGSDQLRWTFGLQRAIVRNARNTYVLLWENETEETETSEQPKDFLQYIFKILEAANIDGKGTFKIVTDLDFIKEELRDYDYQLTDMPLEYEKGNIDECVRERFTMLLEFTIDEDEVNVVLSNCWRFRGKRLEPLGLQLTKLSELNRQERAEPNIEGEKKDTWVYCGRIEKERFQQWIKDAKELFGTMPARYQLYFNGTEEDSSTVALIRAANWQAN